MYDHDYYAADDIVDDNAQGELSDRSWVRTATLFLLTIIVPMSFATCAGIASSLADDTSPSTPASAVVSTDEINGWDLEITGPTEAEAGDLVILEAIDSESTSLRWRQLATIVRDEKGKKTRLPKVSGLEIADSHGVATKYIFATNKIGDYTFELTSTRVVDGRSLIRRIERDVKIKRPTPSPDDGDDINPQPDPTPTPEPDPSPPDVVPAPVGLRVLFIHESSKPMTREQLNVWNSTVVTKYLNEKCAKASDGLAEWRRWDQDVVVSDSESDAMRDLWSVVKPQLKTLPQMVITVNGRAKVYALPATEADVVKQIETDMKGAK